MKTPVILALLCFTAHLFAASVARDLAVEAKIEQELTAIAPAAVPPFREARIAIDQSHYEQAIPLLRQVLTLAPNFDPAMRRLGSALIETGHGDEGMPLVEAAVHLKRSSANLATLAFALVRRPKGAPSHGDLVHAGELLREARSLPDGRDASDLMLSVQIAMMLQNYSEARTLMPELERIAPNEAGTHFFAAYRRNPHHARHRLMRL